DGPLLVHVNGAASTSTAAGSTKCHRCREAAFRMNRKRHGRCAAAFTAASSDALDNNAFGLPAFCGDVPLVRYGNRTRVACTTAFAANRYRCRERDLVRGQANGGADGRPAIAAAASDTLHHYAARTVARRRNGGAASRLDSSAM